MMKFVSKVSKLVSVFAVAFMFMLLDCQQVNAEAQTIKIGESTLLPGYVAGTKFNIKPLKNGGYVYCIDIHKKTAKNITGKLKGKMDAGVAYIIENGYPRKHFTGEKKKDYYITQSAVWWYLDSTTGSSNLSSSFKTTGSDPYGLRPYIKKLVTEAKKAKKEGYLSPSLNVKVGSSKLSLSKDKKYYVSQKIDANAKNIDGKYQVSLTSAPSGTIVTDVDGNKQSKFSKNEKFLIKVPSSKVAAGKTVSVKAKIIASSKIQKAYKYQPTNETMQPVALIAPIEKNVSDTVKLTATKPTPRTPTPSIFVKKVDKATGKTIAGAILVIKDKSGKVVKEFTSTIEGEEFKDLTIGETYTLEDKEAPVGYEKTDEKVSFTVPNETTTKELVIYNQKKERSIVVNKVDKATGKKIAGAILVIRDNTGKVVKRFESTTTGVEISDLANGIYTIEEEKAPTGYKTISEKQRFTITDETKNIEIVVYNEREEKVVVINKVDKSTGKNIEGAKLVIKDSMGNAIKRFVSGTTGYEITGLANGTYTVEEEEAPKGYKKTDEKKTFTLSDTVTNVSVTIENELVEGNVSITKIDAATGQTLAGAEILVTNDSGEEVARFTSTNSSYILKDLAYGTYHVEEVNPPEGYLLNEEVQSFTIDENNTSAQITIKNVPKTNDVEVPDTGSSQTLFLLLGIAIITMGVGYVYKTNKQQF